MTVRAKHDNTQYNEQRRPFYVFIKGHTYHARQRDTHYFFIVTNEQNQENIFCPARFFELFEIMDEYQIIKLVAEAQQ